MGWDVEGILAGQAGPTKQGLQAPDVSVGVAEKDGPINPATGEPVYKKGHATVIIGHKEKAPAAAAAGGVEGAKKPDAQAAQVTPKPDYGKAFKDHAEAQGWTSSGRMIEDRDGKPVDDKGRTTFHQTDPKTGEVRNVPIEDRSVQAAPNSTRLADPASQRGSVSGQMDQGSSQRKKCTGNLVKCAAEAFAPKGTLTPQQQPTFKGLGQYIQDFTHSGP